MSVEVKAGVIVGNEEAYRIVGELKDGDILELAGVDIHSGWHPEYENVRVVIPSMGECVLLLPFDLQVASA
ncbi:MAG: hypothetical protein DI537_14700 [Stutzerimonas stutzeri]|nr:MAG: hypothetical protein DI537_14700 [Stutzerimonas stutzeri]